MKPRSRFFSSLIIFSACLWAGDLGAQGPTPGTATGEAAVPTLPPPAMARLLGLGEAIDLALRSDPQLQGATVARERSEVQVLRAQLDRFSLRVDSFLTEQWRAQNLGGSAPPSSCAVLAPTQPLLGGGPLFTPLQLVSLSGEGLGTPTAAECGAVMGQYSQPDIINQGFLGQLNLSADLRVPVFSGFRVTANVGRAKHLRDAATATVSDVQRQIAVAALRAYWAARRIELQEAVSAKAIERYDEAVTIVGARVRAGLAAPADLNRIETRRQAERARRADLAGSADEARAQLAVALGIGGTVLSLTESTDELPPMPAATASEVEELLSTARKERPDLRVARLQTLASLDVVRMQRSAYYPQLGLSGLLQFSNNPFNPLVGARAANSSANPFANITGSVFFGATLSLNLFDTLNTYTAVRDATLEVKRLEQEERRVGRAVESDIRVLHARLLHLYGAREPLLRTREIAQDSLGITEKRYKNGDTLILDLIDAQVELLSAELNLANSSASIAQTWGELFLASGRMPPASR